MISGHSDIWGVPVCIDGVPFKPDVECVGPTGYGGRGEVKRDPFGFPAEHFFVLGGLPMLRVDRCLGEFFFLVIAYFVLL